MGLRHVIGLDHVVVSVRDLDAAAKAWRALGFTVSPRGTHSPHMGSANYTIMFGEDYMELLGVLTPTEHNAAMREWLEGQGVPPTPASPEAFRAQLRQGVATLEALIRRTNLQLH